MGATKIVEEAKKGPHVCEGLEVLPRDPSVPKSRREDRMSVHWILHPSSTKGFLHCDVRCAMMMLFL